MELKQFSMHRRPYTSVKYDDQRHRYYIDSLDLLLTTGSDIMYTKCDDEQRHLNIC